VTAALQLPVTDFVLSGAIREGLVAVEQRLAEAVRHSDPVADGPARHLAEAGGKRVRPMLTLLASQLAGAERPIPSAVLDAAVVVELTHLATLYHDDVMDSAPVRRGAPAAHQVWGNSVAILTGDLLFARASRIIADLGADAVRIQAVTFERLCLGQLQETVGPSDGDDAVAHYLSVLANKTGSLIATAGRFGAMFAGCSPEVVGVMIDYGERVGVAFQLADDVIDLASQPGESGKTPGTDLREGVPTLPVLLLRQAADDGDAAARAVQGLLDGDLSDDGRLADAVAGLREHPVTGQARQQAMGWARRAVEALQPLEDGPAKAALRSFAEAAVHRAR
jgi:heptaprenyl diphosphate synthase